MRYAFGFGIALLVIFFCLNSFEPSDQVWKTTINLLDQQVDLDDIEGLPLPISRISFASDILIEQKEFEYLTGLHDNCILSTSSITKALYYLKQKNKFKSVTFECVKDHEKYILFVDVASCWTFSKVVFKGLLRGNDAYRNYYSLEAGDLFDVNKHRHSIEKIQRSFKDDGYHNCTVVDYLLYDYPSKSVKTVVVLNPGPCFYIKAIKLNLSQEMGVSRDFCQLLKNKIEQKLNRKFYTKKLLIKEIKKIRHFLLKKGFLGSTIRLQEHFDNANAYVTLRFFIGSYAIRKFQFKGNTYFTDRQLRELIFEFGRSLSILPESILIQEMIDAYQKKGFWNSTISYITENSTTTFCIEEGARVSIKQTIIHGICPQHEHKIRTFFKSLGKASYFDHRLLDRALKKCTTYLIEHGFLHAKILKQEYEYLQNNKYILHVYFQEGNQIVVDDVTIEGHELLEYSWPFRNKQGHVFNPNILQDQRQWLVNHFYQEGFLYINPSPELRYNGNRVSINWVLNGLEYPVCFGKAIIQGSTTFAIGQVRRELQFEEGQTWDKKKLEQSIMRLRKLGIFETIHVYPSQAEKQEKEKAIIIKLQDEDPFELRVRGGFQQVSKNLTFRRGTTYKLGGSFLYKNPLNDGGFLRADFDLTKYYRNLSVWYQRPWLFNQPIQTLFKIYSNDYIQPIVVGSNKPLYEAVQQGFLVGLTRSWPNVDLGFNVGIEGMETRKLSVMLAQAINFEPDLIDKQVPYFFFEPNVVLNFLDDQLNSNAGALTIVSIKGMFPWAKISTCFFKIIFEQAFFFPIIKSVRLGPTVLALRLRFGHILNREFKQIMPPERFYLGGSHSIRSYEPDFAPPLGSFIDEKGERKLVPQGGRTMVNFNIELRFPMMWNFGGVVFHDMGMLIEKSFTEAVKGNRYVAGTGFGLRYHTPVGPFRFDFGWKWKRLDEAESKYAWFLTLGQAF